VPVILKLTDSSVMINTNTSDVPEVFSEQNTEGLMTVTYVNAKTVNAPEVVASDNVI
jgi:hypothetical protein